MDFKFTTIAHKNHLYCSPISKEKVDRILEVLNLPPDSSVIDIGCGKAEILLRLVELYQALPH